MLLSSFLLRVRRSDESSEEVTSLASKFPVVFCSHRSLLVVINSKQRKTCLKVKVSKIMKIHIHDSWCFCWHSHLKTLRNKVFWVTLLSLKVWNWWFCSFRIFNIWPNWIFSNFAQWKAYVPGGIWKTKSHWGQGTPPTSHQFFSLRSTPNNKEDRRIWSFLEYLENPWNNYLQTSDEEIPDRASDHSYY